MRSNLPVSQQEFVIPDGVTLVSTTDLQSRITYCNPAFVAVSGFSREELIGQPHNLVRHPDMPAEAFRDMWATLASGSPWSALVKNRRKNGDHYWVVANATPVVEGGQTVGYMSVRTKPTREQVQQAEALYACMRGEQEQGRLRTVLHRGQVERAGLAGRLRRMAQLNLAGRIGLASTAVAIAGLAVGEWAAPRGLSIHVAAAVAVLAFAAAGAWWLRTQVLGSLGRAVGFANRMAAGDLCARYEGAAGGEFGELARALNQLNVNLQAVVSDVRHEVEGVQVASSEIASGNQDLSARTESQASSLQETAASMEELSSTVQQSANSSREASRLSERSAAIARQGNRAMGEVIATMDGISQSSGRIGEIIGVIDGIAFQTNILALNAAVEAARAGEQGRGFAVVAGEVRSLAQRTLTAAREIKQLIDESAGQVAAGSELVHSAGKTMSEVVGAVEQVNGLIAEITGATQEQAMGLAQINQAVGQLDSVTQQNSAMVEELAAAAASLQAQAKVMNEAVRIFRLERRGSLAMA
ncbi:PAS domain-containing methyl-accepting chemotaxis protein [Hydrogenophaga sp.]|uniref:methyl-accepting chemotaxis protein n=1 Tax=Hydrogenophaga sp. TaxID=1904254 RepID=UPI0026136035|nr:PAS domain-containing methyl-accepting chemotaxis protein [Hydrogenophaga sp.]MCW5653456.1 PAS domain-containing protein [Hydrogenophaga sp.]